MAATNLETCGNIIQQKDDFGYLWTIQNWGSLMERREVLSPEFREVCWGHFWQIKIVPKNAIDGINYTSVYLVLKNLGNESDKDNNKMKVRFRINKMQHHETEVQFESSLITVFGFGHLDILGHTKFIRSAHLTAPSGQSVAGELKIFFNIWMEEDIPADAENGSGNTAH